MTRRSNFPPCAKTDFASLFGGGPPIAHRRGPRGWIGTAAVSRSPIEARPPRTSVRHSARWKADNDNEKADMTKAATMALAETIQFDEGCDPSCDRQQRAVNPQIEETLLTRT